VNCFDCATQDHLTRPGVGVCADCGAVVCEHHLVVRRHYRTRSAVLLRVETIEPPARTLQCTICDAAYAAAHRTPANVPSHSTRLTARCDHPAGPLTPNYFPLKNPKAKPL
jgi:hypothetical protein